MTEAEILETMAALLNKLASISPDGCIAIPIVGDGDKRIGTARRKPAEFLRIEAHQDEAGTAWLPPTAWAYFATCRSRDSWQHDAKQLQDALTRVVEGHGCQPGYINSLTLAAARNALAGQ